MTCFSTPHNFFHRGVWAVLLLMLFAATASAGFLQDVLASEDALASKTNLPADLSRVSALYEQDGIEIKFREELQMRLRDGRPVSQRGGLSAQATDELRLLSAGGQWSRSHTLSETRLDELRRQGEALSGRALPDLNSYMRLQLPAGMDAVEAVQRFAALDSVETAYLIPRPAPVADVGDYLNPGNATGNLQTDPYQRYLDRAPDGIDARWVWNSVYGSGKGVRICDVEYDYNADHRDLPDVTFVGDPQDPPYGDDHGTAVLGVLAGKDNGWGVKGVAYGAASTSPRPRPPPAATMWATACWNAPTRSAAGT